MSKNKNRIKKPIGAPAAEINIHTVMAELRAYANAERYLVVEMDDETAAMQARYNQPNPLLSDPYASQGLLAIKARMNQLTLQAQTWAEAHPEQFEKKKSMELTDGKLGFRTGNRALHLLSRKFKWETVLQLLKKLKWGKDYVRTKEEVDKEAILRDTIVRPATDPDPKTFISEKVLADAGMKVVQEENFFVEPNLTELETRIAAPSPVEQPKAA
jgi:phage host-nuclease inhibitor protein Gam